MFKKSIRVVLLLVIVLAVLFFVYGPSVIENGQNKVIDHPSYMVSQRALDLHNNLFIGDWHADSALWKRDLAVRSNRGHVDIPRLQAGNVALQMFTTVTKSPAGQNYEYNHSSANDNITKLAIAQFWPIRAWGSLTQRALYQAGKLHDLAERNADVFRLIKSQADLKMFVDQRENKPKLVAGLIGTEGSHALDGDLSNITVLFDAGFRMMSLQHFFDNKLGGSLHGTSKAGLSDFGRQALQKMQSLNIMVDLSHSSEQVVVEALALSQKPMLISHTGFKGDCDSARNISDSLMQKIANGGGLIAVGFWDAAVCGTQPMDIAQAIHYGVGLVGAEHVALGSDFDGSVTTAVDSSELAAITQALLDEGLSELEIGQVMGGNMLAFLHANLPMQ